MFNYIKDIQPLYSFRINDIKKTHVQNKHEKEKKFKCNLCTKRFAKETQLSKHMQSHQNDNSLVKKRMPINFTNEDLENEKENDDFDKDYNPRKKNVESSNSVTATYAILTRSRSKPPKK